jgi:septum site-determining protein MinD
LRAARGEMLGIDDILEILATPLLGIIPESQEVLRASNIGTPVTLNNVASAPARADIDAAKRLSGETIEMMIPADRKPILQRLFGRRAA